MALFISRALSASLLGRGRVGAASRARHARPPRAPAALPAQRVNRALRTQQWRSKRFLRTTDAMPTVAKACVDVPVPLAEAFALLGNLENMAAWHPGVVGSVTHVRARASGATMRRQTLPTLLSACTEARR
jgi:hypothetical protein